MKRVIITGAGGFIGANLARRLLQDGQEIHLLLRPGSSSWRVDALRAHAHFHEASLEDASSLARLVRRVRPEWIFHLAAHGAYPRQTSLRRMVQTNLEGTVNLVEACLQTGFEAFVNTGTSSEYGFKDHAPAEREVLEPNSHYAVTKAAATLFCRHTARRLGLHMPTLRLYSVYGPFEEPGRLMPALVMRGMRGELPPLVAPETARDYVYADDVSEAYLRAALRKGSEHDAVYNVGTGVQTTLAEAVEIARGVLGIEAEPRWGTMERREWDTNCWVSDNRKIRDELGWEARYSLAEGFRLTAQWFQDNPSFWPLYTGEDRR